MDGHPGDWEVEGPLTRPRWGSRGSLVFSCHLKEEFAGRGKSLYTGLEGWGAVHLKQKGAPQRLGLELGCAKGRQLGGVGRPVLRSSGLQEGVQT